MSAKRSYGILDAVVDKRNYLIVLAAIVTIVFSCFIPRLEFDNSLRAYIPPETEEAVRYKRFLETFGSDGYILIVVTSPLPAFNSGMLTSIHRISNYLKDLDGINEVRSITDMQLFRERGGLFGTYPLVAEKNGVLRVASPDTLETARHVIPAIDLLMPENLNELGLILRVDEDRQFDAAYIRDLKSRIESALHKGLPKHAEYVLVGMPLVSEAVQRYNLQTMFIFVGLSMLIALCVTSWIFKGVRVVLMFSTASVLAIVWLLGLMALVGITLNSITCLSFGLVLMVTVASNIHLATHYYKVSTNSTNSVDTVRQAVRAVGLPCFMCSVTTAVGFASLTLGTCPAAQDLGKLMSVGVLFSFALTMVVGPSILIHTKNVDPRTLDRMSRDLLSTAFTRMESFVFSHHRFCLVAGIALTLIMLVAIPRITTNTHLFYLLSDSTAEIKNFRLVEEKLNPFQNLELVLEGADGAFKHGNVWARVLKLEKRLGSLAEIHRIDSLSGHLVHMATLMSSKDRGVDETLAKPGVVREILTVTSFNREGRALLGRYLDKTRSVLRLSLRIRNFSPVPLEETMDKVKEETRQVMDGTARSFLTGFLEVYATHAASLLTSQGISLFAALAIISILMIIQFRSISLGLLSLIPNLVPLAVIFGSMGWFGIPLDPGTIIVATITIGLSVDDTIHYLTQLRRELQVAGPGADIEQCLRRAYEKTGRALISTSAILFLAFSALLLSPFRPVGLFGFLASLAILAALLADVAFMPSVVVYVKPIRRLVEGRMATAK